jgi:hypothetical protein
MKRCILIVLSVFAAFLQLSAQIEVLKGVKAGLNIAYFGDSDDPSSYPTTTQYAFGAFVELKILNRFSIEPECFYSIKGSNEIVTGLKLASTSSSPVTERLGYLEIPVLLKYNLPPSEPNLCVYAGPSVAFLLDGKAKTEGPTGTLEMDILSQRAGTDFGFVVGTGVAIPTGLIDATLDVRYELGLTKVNIGAGKLYNRVLTVLLGVSL